MALGAKEIGTRIKELREKQHWTQAYLADLVGYSDKQISKWESGKNKKPLDAESISKLTNIFNVSYEYLINGTEKMVNMSSSMPVLKKTTNNLCQELHQLLWKGKRFRYGDDLQLLPLNGVYVFFEDGEKAFGGDRIVRIGTHYGEDNLRKRIMEHFGTANKDRSIFRKNIGRALLNQLNDPYYEIWEEKRSLRKNAWKENQLEKKISQYLQEHFSFVVINVPTKAARLALESKLVGTVAQCADCHPSVDWFGLQSPIMEIKDGGLWQVQDLDADPITQDDLIYIEHNLIKRN